MSTPDEIMGVPATTDRRNGERIRVWDPIVRLFHWTVVFGVLFNYYVFEGGKIPHRYVGYVVAGALAIRIIWGFVGSTHARFTDFVTSPKTAMSYFGEAFRSRGRRYIGHNPTAAIMIIVLIVLLSVICLTGWMQGLDTFWGVEWVQDVHRFFANLIVILASLHATAAVVESIIHRENLILSMVTGRKRAPSETDVDHASTAGGR